MWHTILKSLCTGRAVACAVTTLALCFAQVDAKAMTIETDSFGKTKSGAVVTKFTVTNSSGMKATLIDYGAILQSLEVPDRDGNIAEVTMGFDTVTEYEDNSPYFGATVGRYANRIEGGRFTLDGKEYQLATNNGPNHLHGGVVGFDKVIWNAEPFSGENESGVEFTYVSADGEEGYPGTLTITMRYTLTDDNELKFSYVAETDKPTILNITNHTYWNLDADGLILDHELVINADQYTAVDETGIPIAGIADVAGTPMDFNTAHTIGERIDQVTGGYDHNYVLNREGEGMSLAARVYSPKTGRVMEIHTNQPGIQLYTGNFLDGSYAGRGGAVYEQRGAFCLETQTFPNAPNRPDFPSAELRPGEKYIHETVHTFSTK